MFIHYRHRSMTYLSLPVHSKIPHCVAVQWKCPTTCQSQIPLKPPQHVVSFQDMSRSTEAPSSTSAVLPTNKLDHELSDDGVTKPLVPVVREGMTALWTRQRKSMMMRPVTKITLATWWTLGLYVAVKSTDRLPTCLTGSTIVSFIERPILHWFATPCDGVRQHQTFLYRLGNGTSSAKELVLCEAMGLSAPWARIVRQVHLL